MRELLARIAGLIGRKMWQKFPEDFFYTPLTPIETDEIVISLLKSGKISPNAADKDGNTLLRTTMMKIASAPPEKYGFYVDALHTLLEAGAKPDNEALLVAVKMNSAEFTKMLLDAGAQPDDKTIIESMKFLRSSIAQLLLQAQAERSREVVISAIKSRNLDLILKVTVPWAALELLFQISDGSDEDMKLIDSLIKMGTDDFVLAHIHPGWMARSGLNVELIVEKLLDAGVNINFTERGRQRISHSQTILHKAVYDGVGGADFVRMLTGRGANVNLQDKDGYTPLMSACVFRRGADVITALLDGGANPDIQNKRGETALFFAAKKNDLDTVKLLLQRGANPNIVDAKGDTVLTMALAKRREDKIAMELLSYGADPGFVGANGETAFMTMARLYCDEGLAVCMALLKYNPDTKEQEEADDADIPLDFVNAQDANGDTAIIKAVRDNKSNVSIKIFALGVMEYAGCDKNIANNEGKNAVYYAMEKFTKGKALDSETMLMTFARTFNKTHT